MSNNRTIKNEHQNEKKQNIIKQNYASELYLWGE